MDNKDLLQYFILRLSTSSNGVEVIDKCSSRKCKDTKFSSFRYDGILRFKKNKELYTKNEYRSLEVIYNEFYDNLESHEENLKFGDLELIFKDLKSLFEKKGFIINWKALEKQSLNETINALAMASPFSLEEKQILLASKTLDERKNKISEILKTYTHDIFDNNTLQ